MSQYSSFLLAYNDALAWENAAAANALASTNPDEASEYYKQARELHQITAKGKRTIEDFMSIPKPEFCQSCSLRTQQT